MVKVYQTSTIEVYPEIKFRDYLLKRLGSEYFEMHGSIYQRLPKTKSIHKIFAPKRRIASLDENISRGEGYDGRYLTAKITVTIINPKYLEVFLQIATSYEEEFEVRKQTVGKGYSKVIGEVNCNIEYHKTRSTRATRKKKVS